jgi:uncharacterized protein
MVRVGVGIGWGFRGRLVSAARRGAATLFTLSLLAATAASAECRPDRVELRGPWGTAAFTVEVADTPESRALGLMNRPSMPRYSGMLFIFEPPPGRASFWMENTLIPLDMLFLDQEGRVSHVHHEARPLDRTPIHGGDAVMYVLEINGGMARRLGITEGSELRHPGIDPELAAWPCEP